MPVHGHAADRRIGCLIAVAKQGKLLLTTLNTEKKKNPERLF